MFRKWKHAVNYSGVCVTCVISTMCAHFLLNAVEVWNSKDMNEAGRPLIFHTYFT